MSIEEILTHDESFRYQLLDRLKADCLYFLGYGNRHSKYLWAGNVKDHIRYMKAIWNAFPEDGKPEWLSMEQICEFEQKMSKGEVS